MAKYEGRDLPPGYDHGQCGHCGSVETEYREHTPYKRCDAKGGNCRDTGGCNCYLFRHKTPDQPRRPLHPWEHFADAGVWKEAPPGWEYHCLCLTKVG